ncbi:Putative flippase GtrA (transmembrane translocase of bactoprenol-linked glucose) [Thermomonospora echinospora]|uniref:Putative flippase GtrA (Transmembrane translocase of bactoprenol-linked glucose) n=1 Tax=Thermomonospora echinospora TaxID=1992 RepID=A0A1H6E0Y4_9ACTN|nr:GtrA family protein [Thermomonospora echinospora]SEG90823.1 Putative flippase GtrA (transmembrane translocase of bactoprenol-linked glucose) [Thermomonospora echinospora]
MSLVANLYRRFEHLVRELAKFGSVGALAFVITIGVANALQFGLHLGPLKSNAAATVVATTFAYAANRYWTFRHRDRSGLGREYALFFALNGIGLVITNLVIGFTHYGLGQDGPLAYNAALIVGTGIATLFRFWSYKKWVFLPAEAPPVDPASGLPETPPAPRPDAVDDAVNGVTAPANVPANGVTGRGARHRAHNGVRVRDHDVPAEPAGRPAPARRR